MRKDCKVKVSCQVGGCKGHHHTLLHEINAREIRPQATPTNQVQDPSSVTTSTTATVSPTATGISATQTSSADAKPEATPRSDQMPYSACTQIAIQVAHQIIPVYLYFPSGQRLKTLCLLDTGSNATLVLQALAEKVGFTSELGEISLGGTNTSEVVQSFPVGSLGISGIGRRHRRYTAHSALSVPALNNPGYIVDWPVEKESTLTCKTCRCSVLMPLRSESYWDFLSTAFRCLWSAERVPEGLPPQSERSLDG